MTSNGCPVPYLCPTPLVCQPPIASIMSDGHSTARSLSRIECLNEWITHPSGTLGFSHLLITAEAELALLLKPRLYLGNKKLLPDAHSIALEATYKAWPTNGIHLALSLVLSLLRVCGVILMWGISSLRLRSVNANPTASPSLIPVSLNKATSQRTSSSASLQSAWMDLIKSMGFGSFFSYHHQAFKYVKRHWYSPTLALW